MLWGGFFLVFLILEKSFLLERLRRHPALGRIYALFLVGVAWMLFDNTDLSVAVGIIGGLFGLGVPAAASALQLYELYHALPLLLVSAVAATPFPVRLVDKLRHHTPWNWAEPVLLLLLLTVGVAYSVSSGFSPFLYFNF